LTKYTFELNKNIGQLSDSSFSKHPKRILHT